VRRANGQILPALAHGAAGAGELEGTGLAVSERPSTAEKRPRTGMPDATIGTWPKRPARPPNYIRAFLAWTKGKSIADQKEISRVSIDTPCDNGPVLEPFVAEAGHFQADGKSLKMLDAFSVGL
jgi:hypothetical protein